MLKSKNLPFNMNQIPNKNDLLVIKLTLEFVSFKRDNDSSFKEELENYIKEHLKNG